MSNSGMGPPRPGWYEDPARVAAQRWWDGRGWTEHTSASLRSAGLQAHYERESRLQPWAHAAVIAWPVISILNGLGAWASASSVQRLFDWVRGVFDNVGTPGYVPPPQPSVPPWFFIGILAAGPIIVLVIWQYRAATTAQALGRHARLDPGFGAATWFIPVLSLWMPAQALADCLARDHRLRPRIPWTWALYVGVGFLQGSLAIALPLDRPVGLFLLGIVVLGDVALMGLGWAGVTVIGEDLRMAVGADV
ncbi:MAG: DUF2510 domain-containing protein [Actinomycetota bacterium]|nr:DUF2510 domain-containing protein [Actinomycetota bacterium]